MPTGMSEGRDKHISLGFMVKNTALGEVLFFEVISLSSYLQKFLDPF
jgi:hypothetical protein